MIRAGEASGNLDAVMFRLAEFLDAQNKLRSKVISALFYPVVMTIIGGAIMSILMVSVVPKVTAIFADTGKALPWNTQLLIAISDTVSSWKGLVLLAVLFGLLQLFRRWKSTPHGRAATRVHARVAAAVGQGVDSRKKPSFSWTTRSENENSTASLAASSV